MILTFVGVLVGVLLPLAVLPVAVIVTAVVVSVATATSWLRLGFVAPARARASGVPVPSRRP